MNYPQLIIDSFPLVVNSFIDKELAYLSLTSKPERPIQDRYALFLNNNKSNKDKLFIKEYKRRDIVAFNLTDGLKTKQNSHIEHVIEFKAGSASSFSKSSRTGNFLKKGNEFIKRVASDIKHRKRQDTTYAETLDISFDKLTCAFIGVEVLDQIPDFGVDLFQYAERHNRHLNNFRKLDLGNCMIKQFEEYSAGLDAKAFKNPIKHVSKDVGSFRKIRVKLHLVVVQGNPEFPFEKISE